MQELNRSQEIGVKPLSCGSAQIWQHGTSLMNYLRMVRRGWGLLLAASSMPGFAPRLFEGGEKRDLRVWVVTSLGTT